jgi:integrase
MAHFARLCKPGKVASIRTATIDDYKAKRRLERGRRKGETVSPATINKELRHLKAVLRKAYKWKYLPELPDFEMARENGKLPTYVSPEHFAAIYGACDAAQHPQGLPYSPGDWWRALVVFLYMTGWRISEPLALRRDDLDLDAGSAITRAEDNKGKRDELTPLHPVVVDHLSKIVSFDPKVFTWPKGREALWVEFHRIQKAAGIKLPCRIEHEHTDACHAYGFHDFRRAFATVNAETLTADALQKLMRHKSYTTTQRYINLAQQVNKAVENLHVPDVLKRLA